MSRVRRIRGKNQKITSFFHLIDLVILILLLIKSPQMEKWVLKSHLNLMTALFSEVVLMRDGRIIVTRFLLWVPKIAFNSFGKQTFFDEYLKPHTWSYLKERLGISPGGQQKQATFKLTSSIRKLRRVFIRALNDAKFNDQTQNMFIFNTYTIGRNRKITSA